MVRDIVLKVLKEELKMDVSAVTDETDFEKDLGMDGFKVFGLMMAVYKHVKFTIDMNNPINKNATKTFGELVAAIERSKT